MSDEEPKTTEGTEEPSMFADEFLASELANARSALRLTQIVGSIVFLVVLFYVGGIAMKFHRALQPDEAAVIAKGFVAQRVIDGEPQLTAYLKKEIPNAIQKAPDYVMEQLPDYRSQIEGRLEQELRKYLNDTSTQLSTELDQFLTANQSQLGTVILNGQDPQATQELAAHLRQLFVSYLAEKPDGGESIQEKLDKSLESLGKIKAMTAKLAVGKNLTEPEKKTRRAIAVLLTTIDQKKAEYPLPTKDQIIESGRATYNPAPEQ
jgi:hypothetical protein